MTIVLNLFLDFKLTLVFKLHTWVETLIMILGFGVLYFVEFRAEMINQETRITLLLKSKHRCKFFEEMLCLIHITLCSAVFHTDDYYCRTMRSRCGQVKTT